MVAFGFGHGTHFVYKGQGLREVLEGIQRSRWPCAFKDQPRPSSLSNACTRSAGSGGTPPRQGIHLLSARPIAASLVNRHWLLYEGALREKQGGER